MEKNITFFKSLMFKLFLMLFTIIALNVTSQNAMAQDCDGDGVLDSVDLDDDNDGILDTDECEVIEYTFVFDEENSTEDIFYYKAVIEGELEVVTIAPSTNSTSLTDITGSVSPDGVTMFPSTTTIQMQDFETNMESAVTLSSTYPLGSITLDVSDFDRTNNTTASFGSYQGAPSDAMAFTVPGDFEIISGNLATYDLNTYALVTNSPTNNALSSLSVDNNVSTELAVKGAQSTILFSSVETASGGSVGSAGTARFVADEPFTQVDILVEDLANGGNREYIQNTLVISSIVVGVSNCDNDNDGLPNTCDTDADGDGCPDALEGDEGLTTSDIDGSWMIIGSVDANGVPTLVSGGQQNVSSSDAYVVSAVCDADGDGDTIYEGDADDNDACVGITGQEITPAFFEVTDVGLSDSGDNWSASWGDYDGDGNPDLFVTTYDASQPNKLYHNNGDGTFTAVSSGSIVTDLASSLASTWGDYDNDGDLDLFVANNIGSPNYLYRNEGGGVFTSIQGDPIVSDWGYSHSASWADYDNDGYLDLFVADYMPSKFNQLYHNNGDGTFTKVTDGPVVSLASFSVNGSWADFDNDGDLDLFVANTNGEDNVLYINNGFGSFTESNQLQEGGNSVGSSWGDYDNDGDLDLYVTNTSGQNNFFYENDGDGTFTKITTGAIVTDGGHSHGSAWGDLDNDGDLDLIVTDDQKTNTVYNNNGDGTFTETTDNFSSSNTTSFGVALADADGDCDLDMFVANHDGEINYYQENVRGQCNNTACISLVGTNSNTSAIGAKVWVKATIDGQDVWQMRELSSQTGGGTGGQNELSVLFGVGDATTIDSIKVEWPSGHTQYLTNQTAGCTCISITEDDASTVCGVVYHDANGNCIQDVGEEGIPNIRVEADPGTAYAITDENGNYEMMLPVGSYTVTADVPSNWTQTCLTNPPTYSVDVLAINQTYCGNDFAYEAACPNPDLSVELATTALRVGFKSLYAISYTNNGTTDATNVTLDVDFTQYIIPLESTVNWSSSSGNVYTWNLGTVAVGETQTIYVTDSVSASAPIDLDVIVSASIDGSESDCTTADDSMNYSERTIGSVDPNDISVEPGYKVLPNQMLTYRIRFQNMGNVNARNVRIECPLPAELDMEDLVMGVSSHNYSFTINNNILVWEFENINLPSIEEDEVGSNGFVFFKIDVNNWVEENTTFQTYADIYFDFNPAVRTNTVENIYVYSLGELDNAESYPLGIYPNPNNGSFSISIPFEMRDVDELSYYAIYDVAGKLIHQKTTYPTERIVVDFVNLTPGHYYVKAVSINQKTYNGKLVVF